MEITDKLIIGITGLIGSGKSQVADYLAKKLDCPRYAFSDTLRHFLDELNLPQNRPNLDALSLSLRTTFGDDILITALLKKIYNNPNQIIILEGIRRHPDIDSFQNHRNFHLLAVDCDERTRWQRLRKRGQNSDDASKSFRAFLADQKSEANSHIKEVMAKAKIKIVNNSSLDALYSQLDQLNFSVH